MKFFIALISLLFLCGNKRIEVVSNWNSDPNDQCIIHSLLGEAASCLKKKEIEIVASDLLHDLKDKEILSVVVWNQPHAVEGKKPLKTKRLPKHKSVLFIWEPPTIFPLIYKPSNLKRFKKIYTWDDSLVDNKKFFKFYYPALRSMRADVVPFKDKKLLAFVFSNKAIAPIDERDLYPARKALIEFFETKEEGEFECYGRGWEHLGYKNYKGIAESKSDVIKNFRFTVAYENTKDLPGYVTEKIFDAFEAGSVPIYWGAPNIEQYVPKNCFIDRRQFTSNEELYTFLKEMDEETYTRYLENIHAYLKSEKAALFSIGKFQEIFLQSVGRL